MIGRISFQVTAGSLLVLSMTLGCSEPKEKEKSEKAAASGDVAAASPTPVHTPLPPPEETALKLGIPPFCKAEGSDGQLCLTCQPRSLPLNICREVSAKIDPAVDCSWTSKKVACADQLEFELGEREVEKVFAALPLYLFVARGFVGNRLKDSPQAVAIMEAGLTFLESNSYNLFTGQNTPQVRDNLLSSVKTAWPQATEADLAQVESAVGPALEDLAAQVKAEKIDQKAMMDIALRVTAALPIPENTRSKIDFAAIRAAIAEAKDDEALVTALMRHLGISSLDELISQLQPKETQLRLLGDFGKGPRNAP